MEIPVHWGLSYARLRDRGNKGLEKKDNWTRCKIYQEFPGEVGQVQPVHVLPKPEWIVLQLCFSDTLNVVHYVMQNLSIISS